METSWPGCPEQIWDAVDDDGSDLWVPSPGMLPSWGSPRDLIGKYLVVPAWWQRAVLVIVFLCVAIVAVASGAHRFDWDSYGPFKRVLAVVLVAVIIGGVLGLTGHYIYREVRWRRHRPEPRQRPPRPPVAPLRAARPRPSPHRPTRPCEGACKAPHDVGDGASVAEHRLDVPQGLVQRPRTRGKQGSV